MAVTKAMASSGIVIYVGDAALPDDVNTWTPIADVTGLDGPESGRALIDCTHMTSPGNRQEFISGQKLSGKLNLSLSFAPSDPTQDPATGLMKWADDGTKKAVAVVFNDQRVTTFLCTVIFENVKVAAPLNGKVDATCSAQITGDFEWTTGGVS